MFRENIPQQQWTEKLEGFALQHAGWLASMEIYDPVAGHSTALKQRPLESIMTYDDGKAWISFVFGPSNGRLITETVESPVRVDLLETDQLADVGLEVETRDGKKVVLHFRSPMRPEMVDGLMRQEEKP